MNAAILSHLRSFHLATRIPCAVFDRDGRLEALFCAGRDEEADRLPACPALEAFRRKLRQDDPRRYVIVLHEKLRFVLLPVVEQGRCSGSVAAGPFWASQETPPEALRELPDGRDLETVMHCGKLLALLVNGVQELDAVQAVTVAEDFNPFLLEQYFIDSQQYALEMFGEFDPTGLYTRLNEAVLQRDAAALKLLLQQMLGMQFPQPVSQKKAPGWNSLRLKKNMLLSFFSVFHHIIIQQNWNSVFYIYFSSLYITAFEDCPDSDSLLSLACELVDHLFTDTICEQHCGNPYIRDACFYICRNLSQRLDLTAAAERVGLSPPYFSRLFKQEMGVSFKQYVDRARITYSKNLLRFTQKSITEISVAVAVEPASNFSLYFKKHTGMTPTEYRAGEWE